MASGLLPKSPVSSSLCDEVPHIFIPKSHLEPREFLISSAKRLLQQYRHLADIPERPAFVRYWSNKWGECQKKGHTSLSAGNAMRSASFVLVFWLVNASGHTQGASPFAQLSGQWSGSGTIDLANGAR